MKRTSFLLPRFQWLFNCLKDVQHIFLRNSDSMQRVRNMLLQSLKSTGCRASKCQFCQLKKCSASTLLHQCSRPEDLRSHSHVEAIWTISFSVLWRLRTNILDAEGSSHDQNVFVCVKTCSLYHQFQTFHLTEKLMLMAVQIDSNSAVEALSFPYFLLVIGKWFVSREEEYHVTCPA